jgi:hypothetical protein
MKKLNGFENWMIHEAITHWVKDAEQEILDKNANGGNSIFAPGYFTIVKKDLLRHIDDLTKTPIKKVK